MISGAGVSSRKLLRTYPGFFSFEEFVQVGPDALPFEVSAFDCPILAILAILAIAFLI